MSRRPSSSLISQTHHMPKKVVGMNHDDMIFEKLFYSFWKGSTFWGPHGVMIGDILWNRIEYDDGLYPNKFDEMNTRKNL